MPYAQLAMRGYAFLKHGTSWNPLCIALSSLLVLSAVVGSPLGFVDKEEGSSKTSPGHHEDLRGGPPSQRTNLGMNANLDPFEKRTEILTQFREIAWYLGTFSPWGSAELPKVTQNWNTSVGLPCHIYYYFLATTILRCCAGTCGWTKKVQI